MSPEADKSPPPPPPVVSKSSKPAKQDAAVKQKAPGKAGSKVPPKKPVTAAQPQEPASVPGKPKPQPKLKVKGMEPVSGSAQDAETLSSAGREKVLKGVCDHKTYQRLLRIVWPLAAVSLILIFTFMADCPRRKTLTVPLQDIHAPSNLPLLAGSPPPLMFQEISLSPLLLMKTGFGLALLRRSSMPVYMSIKESCRGREWTTSCSSLDWLPEMCLLSHKVKRMRGISWNVLICSICLTLEFLNLLNGWMFWNI